MSTKTTNLNLEKPGRGEYTNAWDIPVNGNFDKIDSWAGDTNLEIQNARGNAASLVDRLDQCMDANGNVLPTDEIKNARTSFLYGNRINSNVVTQFPQINTLRDTETWKARQLSTSLLGGIAFVNSYGMSLILDGQKNSNGEPVWGNPDGGTSVSINGSITNIVMSILGKAARIRTNKSVTVNDGYNYVYATYQADGAVTDSGSGSAGYATGAETLPENLYIFKDSTLKNFVASNVKVGDILRLSGSNISGDYLIAEIHPNAETGTLKITGQFPSIGTSAYTVIDPFDVVLGTVSDESLVPSSSMVMLEASVSGGAVVSCYPRHFGTTYVGDWRSVDTSTTPTFEESWNHRLGSDKIDVVVQARTSLTSDWVETLCNLRIDNNLSVAADISAVTVDVVTPGLTAGTLVTSTESGHTHDITGAPDFDDPITATLSGEPSASLGGSVYQENAVSVAFGRNKVKVKNAVASKFFKDYDGVSRQTGYIRVIVTKRG